MLSRLCVSDHPAATWAGAVEPWLRAHGPNWREARAVLAPNAAWIAALKAAAVEAGLPAMGVVWHTPGKWRAQALRARPGPELRVALREDLHLLLELAAAQLPDNPLARAYGKDAAPFQELLDTLEGAGWSADVLPDSAARELAAAATWLRKKSGWVTAAAADLALRETSLAGAMPPLGKYMLAVGFGPADWALRSLLEVACAAYAETELVLDVAGPAEQTAAAAWIGSWEEKMGGTVELLEASEISAPFAPLALRFSEPPPPANAPAKILPTESLPRLWLAENLQAEADLVVAQALAFLSETGENSSARVGLVVGSVNSPLAREVAARLVALGLPHHDSPGHLPGRARAQARFEAWLDWQERGRLAGFLSWVRAEQFGQKISESVAEKIEDTLQKAAQATLSDDPAVLAAWLADADDSVVAAREFLAAWPRLPESASWEIFFHTILPVAEKLGWPEAPEALADRVALRPDALAGALPRDSVLRWVRAVTRVPGRTRDALGREPLAPLQIVDAASAAAHRWTHLVLGGLQHGEWPGDNGDSPLLDDAQLHALNHKILRQGPQGEGHQTVAPGYGLLISQSERRKSDRAAFARLLGLPTAGLALTSRRADPADGRPARLSEYFWAVAKSVLRHLPTEADWAALAAVSVGAREIVIEILSKNSPKNSPNEENAAIPGPRETAAAFAARRDPGKPFDEFSFCLKSSPAAPLRLSCKAWQDALAQPGAAWFQHVLKAKPRWDPATEDFTRRSCGTWAHNWVRPGPRAARGAVAPESFALPSGELWQKSAEEFAREWRAAMAKAFTVAGRTLPESWLDTWAEAGRIAGQWIGALADAPEWPQSLAEINLPSGLQVTLPGHTAAIPLTGRMDLVLWPRPVTFAPGKLGGIRTRLVDFKSGAAKPLTVKLLAASEGVQLALYALALRALGAGELSLDLLNRDAESKPLDAAELFEPELAGLWQLLADCAISGRWGDRSDLANKHEDAGHYPAATLAVPGEILRRKWELTHHYPV